MTRIRKIDNQVIEFTYRKYWKKDYDVGEAVESNDYTIGGHRWSIQFYPKGKSGDDYNKGYASLFIAPKSNIQELAQFFYDIAIIDQYVGRSGDYRISTYYGSLYFRQVTFLSGGSMFGMPHFISLSRLESHFGYVYHDAIKFKVSIGVFTCHPPMSQLERNDLIYFQVADLTFCADNSMLATRCPMLLQPSHAVVITDVEPQIFKVVLWYIYHGSLDKRDEKAIIDSDRFTSQSFAAKLLVAADKFELKKLRKMCECIMSGKKVHTIIPNFKKLVSKSNDVLLQDKHDDKMITQQFHI